MLLKELPVLAIINCKLHETEWVVLVLIIFEDSTSRSESYLYANNYTSQCERMETADEP